MKLQQVHFWQKTCSSGRLRCSWQALARHDRSTAQRVGIVHPEPGRRPPGRRFVLQRTSGPRPCTSHVGMSALERGLLLLLRACTPPSQALPQPAPPPQPWPPSGVHFHPSLTRSSVRSVRASFLPFVPCVQLSCGASTGAAAATASGSAWKQAVQSAWPPGGAMAAVRCARPGPVSASQKFKRSRRKQQKQQQRRLRPQKGDNSGLGGSCEA